jgi:transcriptional regulator with XRE-family HTH domain
VATSSDPDAWSSFARAFGLRLYEARAAVGLSQENVAHSAGISVYTYQKLEHGLSNPGTPANPRLKTLVGLAKVLGVEVAQLLTDSSSSRRP